MFECEREKVHEKLRGMRGINAMIRLFQIESIVFDAEIYNENLK